MVTENSHPSTDVTTRRDQRTRVLCVDDNTMVVRTVQSMVQSEPSLEWIGSLDRADDLVAACRRDRPDIVVLDIQMPGADVFEVLADLSASRPVPRAIMLTSSLAASDIERAIESGAWGFVSKLDSSECMMEAILAISAGSMYFSPTAERVHALT